MEKSLRKARKNMERRIERRKPKIEETAPRACTPHRGIARYPGSHSGGFCPHRATARLTRVTARSKVNSGINADRAPERSPPRDRTVASGRKLMKAKIGISSIRARAKSL
ncbi:hypothetical protein PIB30_060916 [Stylosanthes scabra]|uniref:Uncharacterized protein n=1 Tax=Stylosanthes scabra TaxID=79078 RepID=A0ABU6QK53_9FABA|nr:hypothetical protein [Stylosanthes scabra]